jgi:hypothetical protein
VRARRTRRDVGSAIRVVGQHAIAVIYESLDADRFARG